MRGPEDSKKWPKRNMLHITCITCKGLMDTPHCENGGCPWCFSCGPNSMKNNG